MRQHRRYIAFIVLTLVLIVLSPSVYANAATKFKKLENKKVYHYDITKDGKSDKIKVTYISRSEAKDRYAHCKVYINGRLKVHFSGYGTGGAFYYKTSKKNEYIIIREVYMGGASSYRVYQWKKKKLREIGTLPESDYNNADLKAKSDYLTYKISERSRFKSYLGDLNIKVKVRISKGKIKLVSKYASVSGKVKYTTDKSFYLMKKAGGSVSNGVKVPSGKKIKITKAYLKKVKGRSYFDIYYKASYGKHTGWLPDDARLVLE